MRLPTRKTLLLLAVLAESSGRLVRTEVARTVWDAGDPKAAGEGLRTALAALRKALPEGAIEADRDGVGLRPGFVVISEEDGEFMPGFDNDWVVERRLRTRSQAVRAALSATRDGGAEALAQAELACRIDPLDGEAAAVRSELLRAAGRGADAAVFEDARRARLLREVGVVAEPRTPPSPVPEHPLIVAAEWTLERDPQEACSLLAGTQNQWLTVSVERALEIHRRVLAANPRPSRERDVVQVGEYCFLTLNGKIGPLLERVVGAYREAVAAGEGTVAAKLAETIAYGYLSRGDFPQAIAFAREGLRGAQTRDEPMAVVSAELTLSIIEQHARATAPTHRRLERIRSLVEDGGSPYMISSFRSMHASSLLLRGEIEKAAAVLDSARRIAEGLGSERLCVWILLGEANLYERTGDSATARTLLERLREAAPAAGQSAIATANDALFRINCDLREFDAAAEALARGAVYRRSMGTVASRFERAQMTPSLRILRDRLDPRDLATALQRARGEGPMDAARRDPSINELG